MCDSHFFMVEGKRRWQAQNKNKAKLLKTKTRTQAHQPISYELQDYFFEENYTISRTRSSST